MLIIKTMPELLAATAGSIVTYFAMKKKKSASDLHIGINKSLEEGRKYGNKTVVAFWYDGSVENFLDPRFVSTYTTEWDKEGCIAWAQSQNVDIVFVPDYEDEIATFNIPNLKYYKDFTDKIWTDENYASMFVNPISSEKTKAHCVGKLITNSGFKHIFSSKDGITRFVEKHFIEKYTNSRAIISDPVKSSEGIYYSSVYFKYTDKEKLELSKVESAMRASNLSGNVDVMGDNIKSVIDDIDFVIQNLDVISNEKFLGPNSKIIEIKFSVGKDENIKYDHFAILV
jgi:hypothetical protein